MNMNDLHRRLLRDVLEVGNDLPFVLAGGYAVQAHGIVDRLSRDIDVATNSSVPMGPRARSASSSSGAAARCSSTAPPEASAAPRFSSPWCAVRA